MEFFKLDSSYLPSTTVRDFDSLIWTERFETAGEFQLVVENDVSILTTLPIGSLVSHTDTTEVMLVENHEIDRDSKKALKISVSGRTFETFSENRTTIGSGYSLTDPITGNQLTEIHTSTTSAALVESILKTALQSGSAATEDVISNLVVRKVIRDPDVAMDYVVNRGDIYTRVLEYLKIAHAGIKAIRPNGAQTTLDLVIYDGLDLTGSVIFYAQYEDLDDAKYFWSNKAYKTHAKIAAKIYWRLYRNRDLVSDVTGLNRRVIYLDANDLEGNYTPPAASDVISARGQAILDVSPMISLVQAKISKTAKPKFKYDYDMGDLVTVFGEFGIAQPMRVVEHVLTVDKKGILGFPSLSAI